VAKASDDPITPEPFWFLNPRLGRLAILERRFVAQWIHDDGAAADWIQGLLTLGWLPWYADVAIEELDDVRTVVRANRMTMTGAVLRWFWQTRYCTPINWNSSNTIYVGPSILTWKDPDGFEHAITDGHGRVRIELSLIRFYHPVLVYRLRSDGLMPWPEEPPAEPPAEPPEEAAKSDEMESKDTVSDDIEAEHVMPPPRSRKQKAIQEFIRKTYGSKWWTVETSTIILAASEDKEFNKLVRPFPDRSTFNRSLGRKDD
jgi:hypothetical protein